MFVKTDPCGIFCLLIVYGALLYADYAVINWLLRPSFENSVWGIVHIVGFNSVLILLLISHVRAVFSDPGVVSLDAAPSLVKKRIDASKIEDADDDGESHSETEPLDLTMLARPGSDWTSCGRCEIYRPPRAHHCRICRQCVRKMDHHCPWINNCVGEYNQKYFLQFLFYVDISCIYCLCLVAFSWHNNPNDKEAMMAITGESQEHHLRVLHSVFLSVESVLFGLFATAVSCDQWQAVLSDETAVEQVKGSKPSVRRSKMSLVRGTCGTGSPVLWLFPCVGQHAQKYNNRARFLTEV